MKTIEKARAYDEAIERGKSLLSGNQLGNAWIYKLLPELKESDGERIRKEIIRIVDIWTNSAPIVNGIPRENLLAWLEKQHEQKDILEDAVLDNNEDGLIAETIRHKKENEQNSIKWTKEDENHVEAIISTIKYCKSLFQPAAESYNADIEWLKSLKDRVQLKQEWSEEDNMHLTNAILAAEKEWGVESCTSKWLKSLRPQPKLEWNEEDEKMYASIMDDTVQENQLDEKQIGWLRNIKYRSFFAQPKKQWKPTEEQIRVLEYYIDAAIDTKDMAVICGLYSDLKHLKLLILI